MTGSPPSATTSDSRGLASSLAPVIADECEGRLTNISWFKADWQRGGAATGHASYRTDDHGEIPVVVKIPVSQRELFWTRSLQTPFDAPDPVIPRLYASGETVGGYDLAWIILERFEHGPLGLHWHEDHVRRIADAVARFQHAARDVPVDRCPAREDWPDLVDRSLKSVRLNKIADSDRWTKTLKMLRSRLPDLVEEWRQRPVEGWLHGDLHIANAMSRHGMDEGPVALIDLAEVHPGHWVEDAVYLERQLWARPERMKPHRPVRALARARKRLGLPVEEGATRLASIRRLLMAATAPRYMQTEGHPLHLAACLDRMEQALSDLA